MKKKLEFFSKITRLYKSNEEKDFDSVSLKLLELKKSSREEWKVNEEKVLKNLPCLISLIIIIIIQRFHPREFILLSPLSKFGEQSPESDETPRPPKSADGWWNWRGTLERWEMDAINSELAIWDATKFHYGSAACRRTRAHTEAQSVAYKQFSMVDVRHLPRSPLAYIRDTGVSPPDFPHLPTTLTGLN